VEALREIDSWPVGTVAAAAIDRDGELGSRGPRDWVGRWASVTKLVTAYACLVAVEEGTLELDEPAGPPGSTVRHLLAHASGLPFEEGPPIARAGARRIYSNPGFEVLEAVLSLRAAMPFADYLERAVLQPLGLHARLDPAERWQAGAGLNGSLDDLIRFARELLQPTLVAPETLAEATTVAFPGLAGVLPGVGRFDPMDWGLGFELKDAKPGHWTGSLTGPRTFGHFGGSGSFLWVDPEAAVACVSMCDTEFGPWSLEAWPRLSDAVLRELAAGYAD
jgi:CubicO group peptidase (beta-lactamase class C family)